MTDRLFSLDANITDFDHIEREKLCCKPILHPSPLPLDRLLSIGLAGIQVRKFARSGLLAGGDLHLLAGFLVAVPSKHAGVVGGFFAGQGVVVWQFWRKGDGFIYWDHWPLLAASGRLQSVTKGCIRPEAVA